MPSSLMEKSFSHPSPKDEAKGENLKKDQLSLAQLDYLADRIMEMLRRELILDNERQGRSR